jgi:hypothetical protein
MNSTEMIKIRINGTPNEVTEEIWLGKQLSAAGHKPIPKGSHQVSLGYRVRHARSYPPPHRHSLQVEPSPHTYSRDKLA